MMVTLTFTSRCAAADASSTAFHGRGVAKINTIYRLGSCQLMAAAEENTAKQGKTYDHLFKLVLVGDYDVGKQELIKRFVEGYFQGKYVTNVAVDLRVKTVEVDGKKIKLQLWDTVGNERFRSLTSAYFRGAHGVLLVYDVGNAKSFGSVSEWNRQVAQYGSPDVNRVLVANRCHQETREVSQVAGEELARELGYKFFEVSAQTGQNVQELFLTAATDIKLRLAGRPAENNEGCISLIENRPRVSGSGAEGGCCV